MSLPFLDQGNRNKQQRLTFGCSPTTATLYPSHHEEEMMEMEEEEEDSFYLSHYSSPNEENSMASTSIQTSLPTKSVFDSEASALTQSHSPPKLERQLFDDGTGNEVECVEEKVEGYCGIQISGICDESNGDEEIDDGSFAPCSSVLDIQNRTLETLGSTVLPLKAAFEDMARYSNIYPNESSSSSTLEDDPVGTEVIPGSAESTGNLQHRLNRMWRHRIHHRQKSHMISLRRDLQPFQSQQTASNVFPLRTRSYELHQIHPQHDLHTKNTSSSYKLSSALVKDGAHKGCFDESLGFLECVSMPLWQCGSQCAGANPDATYFNSPGMNLPSYKDDGYDSDPEINTKRHRNLLDDDKENINPDSCSKSRICNGNRGNNMDSKQPINYSFCSDDASLHLVQEMFNDRFTLLLHHHTTETATTKESQQYRSLGIYAWLERGHDLPNRIITPKLTWKRILGASSLLCPQPGSQTHCQPSVGIDLMDVQRILKGEDIVSKPFVDVGNSSFACSYPSKPPPLAKRSHTLCIHTLSTTTWLEAKSVYDRDRFLTGLKLVVARLISLAMCHDYDRLWSEYFHYMPESIIDGTELYDTSFETTAEDDDQL